MGIARGVFGAFAAGSLVLSSTAAIAAAPAPTQQIDPWAALSVLSGGAPAAAICGSSSAAMATAGAAGCVLPVTDAPPPPPPAAEAAVMPASAGVSPLFFAISAMVVGIGIWAFAKSGGQNKVGPFVIPISPA